MRYTSAVVIVWAVCSASAGARDLYVDNVAGDDRFDGSAAIAHSATAGPCRTIARALREAIAGDRIFLANSGQPYRESITLQAGRHSGAGEHPFQLAGNGAVLDGAAPIAERLWKHVRGEIFAYQPPQLAYQLLFLGGKPAARVLAEPAVRSLPPLKALEWCLFDRQIYFRTEPGHLPLSYELSHSALPVGITLYEVRDVVISDLTVQGFQRDGINAHDGVFGATFRNVTCRGNARSGISIGGASRVTLETCLVGNNGTAQVRTEGYSHTRLINCDLLDNTAPPVVREGGKVYVDNKAPREPDKTTWLPLPADRKAVSFATPSVIRRTAY
jgi:hypothetical protein